MTETLTAPAFRDHYGRPLVVGSRVHAHGDADRGLPRWAVTGEVVGFGRTCVRVRWVGLDGYRPRNAPETHSVPTDEWMRWRQAPSLRLRLG